ncbi:MAG: beta subunit (hemoprotein) [Candidatus Tokpelaia sp. JSC188]|nr:MAG: beta subunit (hemoprotein) [Candidatus Tokpelaia sp. JSC188]
MSNKTCLQPNNRRWACPGLYRMPPSADGGICRIKIIRGCLTLHQMYTLAEAAEKYGNHIIELTTRANVQIRGVMANNKQKLIDILINAGLGSSTIEGDDVRNIMLNPTAGFDRNGSVSVIYFAESLLHYLQTSVHYQLLSPKFSFYIDGGEKCFVTKHTNDVWLSLSNNGKFFTFGIASCLPSNQDDISPVGIVSFAKGIEVVDYLLNLLFAAQKQDVAIQRMKHLVSAWGREQISMCLRKKIPDIIPVHYFQRKSSQRRLDLGIHKTRFFGRYYLGIKPPLGRLTPQLLYNIADTATKILSSKYVHVTPWQGLIFPNCAFGEAKALEKSYNSMGLISDNIDPYANILSCSGLPSCASALADTQADAHDLAYILRGKTFPSIHLTGCSKSCMATQSKPITLLAVDFGYYNIYYSDAQKDSKFGRLVANKVTISEIAAVLSTNFSNT